MAKINCAKDDLWEERTAVQTRAQEVLKAALGQFPYRLVQKKGEQRFGFKLETKAPEDYFVDVNLKKGTEIVSNGGVLYKIGSEIGGGVQGSTFNITIPIPKKKNPVGGRSGDIEAVAKFSRMVEFPELHRHALNNVIQRYKNNSDRDKAQFVQLAKKLIVYLDENEPTDKVWDDIWKEKCSEPYNDATGLVLANEMVWKRFSPSYNLPFNFHIMGVFEYDYEFYQQWFREREEAENMLLSIQKQDQFLNTMVETFSLFNIYLVAILEKLDVSLSGFLEQVSNGPNATNVKELKSILTQIFFALYFGQKKLQLNHTDLHHNNVLLKKVGKKVCIYYVVHVRNSKGKTLNTVYYRVPTEGLLAVIIDYGRFQGKFKLSDGKEIEAFCTIEAEQYPDASVAKNWKWTEYGDMIRFFWFLSMDLSSVWSNPLLKDIVELTKTILKCCDQKPYSESSSSSQSKKQGKTKCVDLLGNYKRCMAKAGDNSEQRRACARTIRTEAITKLDCDERPSNHFEAFYLPIDKAPKDVTLYGDVDE